MKDAQDPDKVNGITQKPKKISGGCSTSEDRESSDSEGEQYEEKAQPVKFKVIDIKQPEIELAIPKKPVQQKGPDPNKMLRFETRKMPKSKMQCLIELCSKKQNSMLFMTSQP